ncbi:MAG: hypothetical protein AAGI24_11180 [Pseudomonadota bacterium]
MLLDAADRAIADHRQQRSDYLPAPDFNGVSNRAYVLLWQNGRKLSSWWSQSDNLAGTVYRATQRLLQAKRPAGSRGLEVHIHVLGPDIPWDQGGYRHGVHGVAMRRDRSVSYYPSYAVETNVKAEKLLRRLQQRLNDVDPGVASPSVYYFEGQHFSRGYGGTDITRYRKGSTPQANTAVSAPRLLRMHRLARQWLRAAVQDRGELRYLYYPSRDEFPTGKNNMIRQLMSSRGLAQLAAKDQAWLALHQRNLAFVLNNWYRESGDEGYIWFRSKSKLGANAMALRTLVYSPLFDQHRAQAQRLVNGILSLQGEAGQFAAWYLAPDYVYSETRLLTFYSGEALLALLEYYQKTGDDRVLAAARRGQEYYLGEYVDRIDENYYPAYVPWHTQSLSALYKLTGDVRYATAVFTMTDRLLAIQQRVAGDAPEFLGRFYNPATPQFGSPHASSDGVYTEGLAYAYELALLEDDSDRVKRYREALLLGLHNLDNLQYRDRRLYFSQRPLAMEGAFRIHATDNKVRVDSVQHALDAFDKVAALVETGQLRLDPQR